ncbi:hypothetical protein K439DRAFT_971622 [Ramaria rubella]|nr:hypothetical protein K439DRAFT_971622 [Ramaria rubella]
MADPPGLLCRGHKNRAPSCSTGSCHSSSITLYQTRPSLPGPRPLLPPSYSQPRQSGCLSASHCTGILARPPTAQTYMRICISTHLCTYSRTVPDPSPSQPLRIKARAHTPSKSPPVHPTLFIYTSPHAHPAPGSLDRRPLNISSASARTTLAQSVQVRTDSGSSESTLQSQDTSGWNSEHTTEPMELQYVPRTKPIPPHKVKPEMNLKTRINIPYVPLRPLLQFKKKNNVHHLQFQKYIYLYLLYSIVTPQPNSSAQRAPTTPKHR